MPPGVSTANQMNVASVADIIQAALQLPITTLSADGAIPVLTSYPPISVYAITKGSAAALTLTDPTAPPTTGPQVGQTSADDGKLVVVYSETAFAHVITDATSGFNGKGASGTCTYGGLAKGNCVILMARSGKWWVIGNIGVTVA